MDDDVWLFTHGGLRAPIFKFHVYSLANLAWCQITVALVGHLEGQPAIPLLDVVAVGHTVVARDVAVVPEFLGDVLRHI